MAISFNRKLENQVQFKASQTWLHELTADVRGAEVLIDYTADFTLNQEVESNAPVDDSGQRINVTEVVSAVDLEMKFLATDEKIRQIFTGTGDNTAKGKYWGLTTQLQDYDGNVTGYYTFYKVKISQAVSIALGSNDHGIVVTMHALPNKTCASYTATLPTGACFKPTAVSSAIGIDEFYVTADGATS